MKKFIAGLFIGLILGTGALTSAANVTVAALQTGFQLMVYGKVVPVDKAVLMIGGSYYVPAKAISGALGIKYNVDLKKKLLEIGEAVPLKQIPPKPTGKYPNSNPVPLNTIQAIVSKDIDHPFKAEVQVKAIIRGEEAWKMVHPANLFNSPPKNGYEYLLVKIAFKLTDIPEGKAYELIPDDFNLVSEKGMEYTERGYAVPPDPELRTNLYQGAEHEGWVIYEVKTDDLKPKIAFGRMRDGSGGIWFKAYGE